MIRVWADNRPVGILDRFGSRGSSFAYNPAVSTDMAVSVTMPVRVASWDSRHGLTPIFDMNLPEGALRDRLTRRFVKATGRFDDLDLLGIVGRHQIGRLRYSSVDAEIESEVPFQSLDEVLRARRGGELFDYLLDAFETYSGLSGVQPKVMIRADEDRLGSFKPATHIVKMPDDEFPQLAANEFFCLNCAARLGLVVPEHKLSEDGGTIVIKRFDLHDNGFLGFEDFCVLNGLNAEQKYDGSYESRLFKRLRDFVGPRNYFHATRDIFRRFVLNAAIRNGDAHLKEFGVIYESVESEAVLAPVYDLVTTTAYVARDTMALTLDGSTRWPDAKRLTQLGTVRLGLSPKEVRETFEATADAMAATLGEMGGYFRATGFADIGLRIARAWEEGIAESLGLKKAAARAAKPADMQKKDRLARSDSLIVDALRKRGGRFSGPQRSLAEELRIPPSTLSAALARLEKRKLIRRGKRSLELDQAQ